MQIYSALTVAIIAKNPATIKETLASLILQTIPPREVIVIGFEADLEKIVSSFNGKLNVQFIYEPNMNISDTHNKILEITDCSLLAYLGDDCQAAPDWVKRMLQAHNKYSSIAIQGRTLSLPENSVFGIIEQFNQNNLIRDNMLEDRNLYWDLIKGKHRKNSELLACDIRNLSLKINRIKRLHLKFNYSDETGTDHEFAKQMLSEEEHIVFYPEAIVYRQAEKSLKAFLKEAWEQGKSFARISNNWPPEYHPRTKKPSILRFFAFVYYCIRHKQFLKFPILIVLFLTYQIAFEKGRREENKISQNSLSFSIN